MGLGDAACFLRIQHLGVREIYAQGRRRGGTWELKNVRSVLFLWWNCSCFPTCRNDALNQVSHVFSIISYLWSNNTIQRQQDFGNWSHWKRWDDDGFDHLHSPTFSSKKQLLLVDVLACVAIWRGMDVRAPLKSDAFSTESFNRSAELGFSIIFWFPAFILAILGAGFSLPSAEQTYCCMSILRYLKYLVSKPTRWGVIVPKLLICPASRWRCA